MATSAQSWKGEQGTRDGGNLSSVGEVRQLETIAAGAGTAGVAEARESVNWLPEVCYR